MNKSNKPSWDDAPLEARILVQLILVILILEVLMMLTC